MFADMFIDPPDISRCTISLAQISVKPRMTFWWCVSVGCCVAVLRGVKLSFRLWFPQNGWADGMFGGEKPFNFINIIKKTGNEPNFWPVCACAIIYTAPEPHNWHAMDISIIIARASLSVCPIFATRDSRLNSKIFFKQRTPANGMMMRGFNIEP